MSEPTIIIPTPGRVVWYRVGAGDECIPRFNTQGEELPDPLAAIVAGVDHARNVNLTVADVNGHTFARTNVLLLQPGDDLPGDGRSYAEWMPFQKGQAAKTETAERAAQGVGADLVGRLARVRGNEYGPCGVIDEVSGGRATFIWFNEHCSNRMEVSLASLELLPESKAEVAEQPAPLADQIKGSLLMQKAQATCDQQHVGLAQLAAMDQAGESYAQDGKSLTAAVAATDVLPLKIAPQAIDEAIRSEFYFTAKDGVLGASEMGTRPNANFDMDLLTICVLVLRDGFKVIGQSACVERKTFDAALGRQYAREDAVRQVWPLLGYELRTQRTYSAR